MPICTGYNGIPNSDCYEKDDEEVEGDNRQEKPGKKNVEEEKEPKNANAPTPAKSFAQLDTDPKEVPLPFCNKYDGNNC